MNTNKLVSLGLLFVALPQSVFSQVLKPYSHGNPTAEEQYMLELINRARADPAAEGRFLAGLKDAGVVVAKDFFKIDLGRLVKEFSGYEARPPMAFNPNLMISARRHSNDMAKKNFQNHTGSDGSTISSRIAQSGYTGFTINESIFSTYVPSVLYAHAGLNIDWGSGPGGVQPDLGHRKNIMGFGLWDYREVGIGVIERSRADAKKYGALAITQDFGTRNDSPFFLVGVAYYDMNKNGICDPGEGLPNIKVLPAAGSYYAVTSASGGYAIPFAISPGASSATFSGGGLLAGEILDFSLVRANAKLDLRILSGTPFVTLSGIDGIASEKGKKGGGAAVFRISRVGPVTSDLSVVLTRPITGGKGVALPTDYKISAVGQASKKETKAVADRFTVKIPKGKRFADIKISAMADKLAEPTEKAVFNISPSAAYRTGSPSSVVISIVN